MVVDYLAGLITWVKKNEKQKKWFFYIMPNFLFILTRFKKHDSLKMFLVVSNITFPHLFLFSVAQFDLWMVSVFFFK